MYIIHYGWQDVMGNHEAERHAETEEEKDKILFKLRSYGYEIGEIEKEK